MSGTPDNVTPPQRTVQNVLFGVILILLFIAVCRLFAPFFTVLLWSVLVYIVFSPLHHRLIKNLDFSTIKGKILKSLCAGVFALGTVVIILVPLIFVTFQFFRQIVDLLSMARDLLNNNPDMLQDIFDKAGAVIVNLSSGQINLGADQLREQLLRVFSSELQNVIQFSSSIVRNLGTFVAGLFLMTFSLFFFYTDGSYLSRLIFHAVPIRKEYISAIMGKFMDITRNLFFGYILVAIIQTLMAYIIFRIFRVQGALVFAGLTFICVFIPIFGGGLVWIPLGLARVFSGDITGGIAFLAVSGFFISTADNFIRPWFLQNRIHLHPLIIFFAILGGVSAFGFNGVVLGPMVVILFLTVLDLFLIEHDIKEN
ncbi:MAG: AI-2E family transporter [Treponema sp.]|jgi:predicted PurR-regulated permease PerM|nr:AI-2E family transporter [Treponema sp.]